MASCIPAMNGSDFLGFMNEPNFQARIIEEYNSMFSMEREEIQHRPEQKEKLENKGCLPLAHYLHCCTKLSNYEAILGASFVDGYDVKQKFLCTENPRKEDCDKYWQAAWDHKVQIIVMTCLLTANSYQYWSPKEGSVLVYKKFTVKTLDIKVLSHCTITLLSLSDQIGEGRKIFHCQYTAWPRAKFAHQPDSFIDFYRCVDDMNVTLQKRVADKKIPPIIVHCADDVGSSDVFCVFDVCVTQFEATGLLSLPNVVKKIRQQKHGSITRSDLYVLCYKLFKAYLDENLAIGPYM